MRILVVAAVLFCVVVSQSDGQTPHKSKHPAASSMRSFAMKLHAAGASGVLLDWNTGKVLSVTGRETPATPGSLLKPLLLSYALQHGTVAGTTVVYCTRTLHVAGRSLACTHPDDRPQKDAEDALASSCNTWFASMARRMTPQDVSAALTQAGLHSTVSLNDADTRILTVLGLQGIESTPMQIAQAYRGLLLHTSNESPVWRGLYASVAYGMANQARVQDVNVLGKTGTATNPGEWWSHGWFAGGIPGHFILAIYVPHGDGGSAAALAGAVIRQLTNEATL